MDIVKIAVFVRKFVVNYPININSVDKQNNKIHEIWHSMNTDETTLLHEVVLYFPVHTGEYKQFPRNCRISHYHWKYKYCPLFTNPEYQ